MTQPDRSTNVVYDGGPFSGQEDWFERLPQSIGAGEGKTIGVYVRTAVVRRGRSVYLWRGQPDPETPVSSRTFPTV